MTAATVAERYLSPSAIARTLTPLKNDRPVAGVTVIRWILHGVKSADGRRVRLRATRQGGRWAILQSDVDEFFAALSARPGVETAPVPMPQSATKRKRSAEKAGRQLQEMGA